MDIKGFLNQYKDYDIRVNHDARYVDQKCTPDIVCFIADCILSSSCANKMFSINDLWEEPYFIENCRVIFGKPSPQNDLARNEYNKVLCQPLKTLAYAHVLNVKKYGKTLVFSVNNTELLEYISIKERNAFNFLCVFFDKVIEDSGLLRIFEEYKHSINNGGKFAEAKDIIYEKYHRFISANTPSKSKTDVTRIFHKVFNLYAYRNQILGSNGKLLNWYDLMYNRINWRDIGNKTKNQTRRESSPVATISASFYIEYQVNKAIRMIKNIQGTTSEVCDDLSQGKATEVHHIFPKSQFPQLASYLENLILITSSQHRQRAHPNSNFSAINEDYQCICLMAKSRTVEKYVDLDNDNIYSKQGYVHVVNVGMCTSLVSMDDSFDCIRTKIWNHYNRFDFENNSDMYVAAEK